MRKPQMLNTSYRLTGRIKGALAIAITTIMLGAGAHAQEQPAKDVSDPLPDFRHVSKTDVSASLRKVRRIRFGIDDKFPPFAYRDSEGTLNGFLPLLIDGLCQDLKIACEFSVINPTQRGAELTGKKVDAVVYYTDPDSFDLEKLDFTRPFMRPFARFVTRSSSPIEETNARKLAGKRIGVREGSYHAQYIATYYSRSLNVAYKTRTELYEAVRTGDVDIIFDDAFRLMFWLQGTASRDCCAFAGRGYLDPASFSQGFTMAVRREDRDLRRVLDYGLDRLQTSGNTRKIYDRFFPQSVY